MRNIKYIAVHCTGTQQSATVESIRKYWKEQLKWNSPGYHYLVKPCGQIVELQTEDQPSNGVAGYNGVTVNVCYIGGLDKTGKVADTRTANQKAAMLFLLEQLKERYPKATIQGHRDFSPDRNGNRVIEKCEWIKDCPCFDAKTEYKNIK